VGHAILRGVPCPGSEPPHKTPPRPGTPEPPHGKGNVVQVVNFEWIFQNQSEKCPPKKSRRMTGMAGILANGGSDGRLFLREAEPPDSRILFAEILPGLHA